ncbi:methyl-accepting chemotaxis protein [Arcobacter porcinus]|uniref:Cache sensor-containing MCP-domain signal transduction protein n=1 Tax=Arcobacter porcinus TaxID=1935204 RepID=A0A5C2HEP0_9BACT|nr:methyl-accepting chemotaxis protein [Arcobacter porcinus]OCL83196.1 Methyl-accepting chemotaxis protein IV [Arcobacter porcinus]OCL88087.1 Methyl-accepting chemotaxis protein IV [Arcobacter porcinus]OCL90205.1 Methyl-accepting chemotaxis protein IV [Aliarcobacter thereius]QEP41393.1 Cache sensor-containing MCP-domain signal transduction protein [Arcobacter porcinus]
MNMNSIRVKLLFITIVPFIIGIFILSGINFEKTEITLNETLTKFESIITKEKEALVKQQFEVARTLIDTVIKQENNLESAKKQVIELLSGIRYLDDKSGYFFAYEKRGEDYYFSFHPAIPKLTNTKTNISAPDVKGYAFREDLIKYAKDRKYVTYHYENPATKEVVLKMASSLYIPEFNWILVTGIYADDIEREISALKIQIEDDINTLFWIAIIVTVLLSIILVLIILPSINKIILKPLNIFQNTLEIFFKYLNGESDKVNRIKNYSKDEIGQMSKTLDHNIDIARKEIDDNNLFIENSIEILTKFQKGDLSLRLDINVDDKHLIKLKSVINQMAEELEKNIQNILKVVNEYSKYKYTSKVDTSKFSNHILELANGVNNLGSSITYMLNENKKNGDTLSSSSNTLLKNVEKLNDSSTSTAANLEETAASLEQMTANLRSSTEGVQDMARIASNVTSKAKDGQNLANQTTLAMEEINNQISSINEAISVIDNIAFQTNILSLNAAVEAATAGEAGKGFAVVAQEVRNLANRSAEAAKEIKDIVELATRKALDGKEVSTQMINGYTELNKDITDTIELIKNFENSSKEQLAGIEQINNAVSILDQKTQQNAAVTLETKEIALSTNKIANLIIEDVNKKEF